MSRITKFVCIPALAIAMVVVGNASDANAGGFSISIGSGGYGGYGGYAVPGYRYSSGYAGYGHGYGYNNGHRAFGPIVYPGYSSRYGSGYRGYSRPHYDYHPPTLVPHRGHYHYQPGHYDLHHGNHGHHRH